MAVINNSAVSEACCTTVSNSTNSVSLHSQPTTVRDLETGLLYLQKMCRLSASLTASERLRCNWYTRAC